MKLVITGASSFIGYHLTRFFNHLGHDVVGTITPEPDEFEGIYGQRVDALKSAGINIKRLDLRDEISISDVIHNERPEVWFHHAGWAKAYGSLDYDLRMGHAVNVQPLRHVYEVLKQTDCRGIILTGSSMEYSKNDEACLEPDACLPATPYGLSKLSETIRAIQLSEQFDMPMRIVRIFIPFGTMDAPQKLIPGVIRAMQSANRIDLSPCRQKRDFLYIGDLVEGYAALMNDLKRDAVWDVFNLCSGEAVRLQVFLKMLVETMGGNPDLLEFGAISMRPGEPPISYGSNQKAREILHWIPRSLEEGLKCYLRDEGILS